jgi:hypothetical protein
LTKKLAPKKNAYLSVTVSTFDGFQGGERDIILISMVFRDNISFIKTIVFHSFFSRTATWPLYGDKTPTLVICSTFRPKKIH